MKIRLTVELDDYYRQAINHQVGKKGKANREACKTHLISVLEADRETLSYDLELSESLDAEGYE